MTLVNGGKLHLLEWIADGLFTGSGDYNVHLFQNNRVPAETDNIDDYVEADFDGYLPENAAGWGPVSLDGSNRAQSTCSAKTFTCTGLTTPNTIYGYYVSREGVQLIWAERNAAGPVVINRVGQTYTVVPKLKLDQLDL